MLLGIYGYARSGKDTIAEHLIANYGFNRIAFADPMREALLRLNPTVFSAGLYMSLEVALKMAGGNWDTLKEDCTELRGLLQRMGTEVGREMFGDDVWVLPALEKAYTMDKVVFTDVRFQNEAKAILDAGGRLWKVVRPGVGPVNSHKSDNELASLPDSAWDAIITNDSTKEDLFAALDETMKGLGVDNGY